MQDGQTRHLNPVHLRQHPQQRNCSARSLRSLCLGLRTPRVWHPSQRYSELSQAAVFASEAGQGRLESHRIHHYCMDDSDWRLEFVPFDPNALTALADHLKRSYCLFSLGTLRLSIEVPSPALRYLQMSDRRMLDLLSRVGRRRRPRAVSLHQRTAI
jgi:hypothetical protein